MGFIPLTPLDTSLRVRPPPAVRRPLLQWQVLGISLCPFGPAMRLSVALAASQNSRHHHGLLGGPGQAPS